MCLELILIQEYNKGDCKLHSGIIMIMLLKIMTDSNFWSLETGEEAEKTLHKTPFFFFFFLALLSFLLSESNVFGCLIFRL